MLSKYQHLKVALVHDYLDQFGGAERVLLVLAEMFPQAPIYTSYYRNGFIYQQLKDRKIITSWVHYIPWFEKLVSPLRFLAPLVWQSFDFTKYDLVISSASWYITKGLLKKEQTSVLVSKKTWEICYCHTPPRWLYGLQTSVDWQKWLIVRCYAHLIGHLMRWYDFIASGKVDFFVSNSLTVAKRVWQYYRKRSRIIYPPVILANLSEREKLLIWRQLQQTHHLPNQYYLVVSRLVGAKGLDLVIEVLDHLSLPLLVVGTGGGYAKYQEQFKRLGKKDKLFLLGGVTDQQLAVLYSRAKGFLALAKDEDFGMTVVESMMAGTPVVAYAGGGFQETVLDGKTGVLFTEYNLIGLLRALARFERYTWNRQFIISYAQKFHKREFVKQFDYLIGQVISGEIKPLKRGE